MMPENLNDDSGWVKLSISVAPELVALGVVPDLQRFFDGMLYKLRRNASKGKWETLSLDNAFSDLEGEVGELKKAIANGSTSEILMEASDAANEALIIASIALEARGV